MKKIEKTIREQMKDLVQQAYQLIESKEGCYSKSDKTALMDMIVRAEQALEGKEAAFSRNREFLIPREEEAICFAYDRYTMVPTFFEDKKVYSHYGLKEAVRWFKEQDLSKWEKKKLEDRKREVLERAAALLEKAICGEKTGMYPKEQKEQLKIQTKQLKTASFEKLPQILADTIDAFIEMKLSQKLYSDFEENPIFRLSEEKLNQIREQIKTDSFIQKQYQQIKEIAGQESFEESQIGYQLIWKPYSYQELNQKFSIWGDTGKVVNFSVPHGTKTAKLSFFLPCTENEEDGLGHIQVTGIRLFCADGSEAEIPNPDFEQEQDGKILYWQIKKEKGQSVCRQEKKQNEGCSFFLSNPTHLDEICIESNPITVKENSGYTLFFRAKQDGKFQKGLQAKIEFLDRNNQKIDEFIYFYNRKSVISVGKKALTMQCHAILYALEGKIEDAQKAKYDLLTFLNDFCQGAEYWMVYNERPEGCDAYGAVQAGRIMCSVASTYSLIRRADVFSKEETKFFYQLTDYLLQYCLDMRDRISISKERVQRGSSNWQTDMCIGAAAMMMVLPDYPNRRIWLFHAQSVLEAQLSINLNADGSWPESIRYHHAALEHFASFAAAWKQETGENWILTTRLKDMFAYTIHTITPPYTYFGNRIGTPPFGDHRLSGGEEFQIYGLSIAEIAPIDRKLADQMYQVWTLAKYPVKKLSGEALVIENLLYTEPSSYQICPNYRLNLESTAAYSNSGIYIFRSGWQSGKENYLAVMGTEKPIGHGHLDQGSFVLYCQNIPIIMDSGIEGYFDVSTQWHLSSYAHACLQFAATKEEQQTMRRTDKTINLNAGNISLDRGWLDVPRTCKVKDVLITKEQDQITLEIEHPAGGEKGIHSRRILFEKKTGTVFVFDQIETYMGSVLFSLPLVAKSASIERNVIYAQGYEPIQIKVEVLTPTEEIWLEKGRTTPMFPCGEEIPMLYYIRVKAQAKDGVKVKIQAS